MGNLAPDDARGGRLAERERRFHRGGSEERELLPRAGDVVEVLAEERQHRLRHRAQLLLHVVLVVDRVAAKPADAENRKQVRRLRSVTSALTRVLLLFSGPDTQTNWPSLMPRALASSGLISTNMSCCNSASHLFERVSSPPPSYSTSRPEVRMIGKFLATPFSMAAFWKVV